MLDTKTVITKEDILENLKNPILGDVHKAVLKLALKGLEFEKLEGGQFIRIEDHAKIVSGVRTYWKSKYDSLVDQTANEIKKLQDELKAKTKTIFEASQIIDDMRAKYRALEASKIINDLRNGRQKDENQIGVLEDKLKDTVTLQYHDKIAASAQRQIAALRDERDALKTENQSLKDSREKLIASVIGMK